jgi:anti-anti-sigma factor
MVTTSLENPPAPTAVSRVANPVVIIALQGDYDITRPERMLSELHAIPTCDIAIVDMREVTHLDTTALTCFIQLRNRLRQSGRGIVRIVGLRPSLYRLYESTNLHHIFEAFETISDAMGEYGYTVNQQRSDRCATWRTLSRDELVRNTRARFKEIMADPLGNTSLRAACDAMRAAIVHRAQGDVEQMRAPLRALLGLEQAAFNARQNCGWLRKRRIELHEALNGWSPNAHRVSGVDELQCRYREIVTALQA